MKYLTFQLYGNLQAWGLPTPGMVRPTDTHPSKSGIVGLLGACLGLTEDQQIVDLQESIGFACREDIPGEYLYDYHTIWPDGSMEKFYEAIRAGKPIPSGKNTLLAERFHSIEAKQKEIKTEKNTIISHRYYLVGALFTVCLWQEKTSYSLETILEGLKSPTFTPFLGRKKCLLGMPFYGKILQAETLKEALQQYFPDPMGLLSEERFEAYPRVFWEGSDSSLPILSQQNRYDQLIKIRTYVTRTEFEGMMERSPKCSKAD